MASKVRHEISYPLQNFNGYTIEARLWTSSFIPDFIMDIINYPCWDWIQSTLIKVAQLSQPRYNLRIGMTYIMFRTNIKADTYK